MSGVGAQLRGFGWQPLGRRQPVIDGLDLTIEPRQVVLLAGGSGAGKSTVLRALAGLLGDAVPGQLTGEVSVDGPAGLLLQNPADGLVATTIGREVAFGPENLALPRDTIASRVREALAGVRLEYPTDRPTSALSGGELQRLALAGVLALRPGLILLDEPTSMLDADTARVVRDCVLDVVRDRGMTAVVVEHRIGPWLDRVDRVVVLERGAVAADTTPADFVRRHSDRMLAAGVWMPGAADPEPATVDPELVRPARSAMTLSARALSVDLTLRSLRGARTHRALDAVDATLSTGELTALTGPSGAGKSTLLAAFAGLQRPTSGAIEGAEPALYRRGSVALAEVSGFVPQNPEHGFLCTTVRAEVAHTAQRLGRAVDTDALLHLMRLDHLAGANPFQLSGGEQRRLAVAAALAHRPAVVLLDEPTVGQDRLTWAAVLGWMRAARDEGATVAAASHDSALVRSADRLVALDSGRVA